MFCVEVDDNKTLLIANATQVEVVIEGTFNEFVKFLDEKGKVVCLFKLNAIKGFYKNEVTA